MSKPEIKVHRVDLDDLMKGDEDVVQDIVEMIGGDDVPDEVKQAIASVIGKVKAELGEPFDSEADAQAHAVGFMAECQPMVGQLVVKRTSAGSGPLHTATIVIDVWPHYQIGPNGRLVNGVVAHFKGKGGVLIEAVDLRRYKASTKVN